MITKKEIIIIKGSKKEIIWYSLAIITFVTYCFLQLDIIAQYYQITAEEYNQLGVLSIIVEFLDSLGQVTKSINFWYNGIIMAVLMGILAFFYPDKDEERVDIIWENDENG